MANNAYEFTKLRDVTAVDAPSDAANVLIEEDGVIKKTPKASVGVKSWDDLTGKPFGDTEIAVIPTMEVAEPQSDTASYGFAAVDPVELTGDYEVRVNGVVYEATTATHSPTTGVTNRYLGGIGSTNELSEETPFCIVTSINGSGAPYSTHIYVHQSVIPATVEVIKKSVTKLDAKYLDNVFIIDTTADDYNTGDIAYGDKVKEALLSGKTVYYFDGSKYGTIGSFYPISSTTGKFTLCLQISTFQYMSGNTSFTPVSLTISGV